MPKWRVRVEKVAFVEVEVEASSGLRARYDVQQLIEDGKFNVRGWHDDGLQVEGAVEVKE